MALTSTIHRFQIEVSDVDRGVYDTVDIRVARHPSETVPYLLTRVLAYALELRPLLSMGRGLSDPDEPAISAPNDRGGLALWIEIGAPSPSRMHKVAKQADDIRVYTHRPLDLVLAALSGHDVHRADEIEILAIPTDFLDALETHLDRNNKWDLLHTEGTLYLTVGESTLEGRVAKAFVAS